MSHYSHDLREVCAGVSGCRMADLGMNIVTVIHQPRYSVFSLFHEVLLLGKAGRTVFQGLSRRASICLPLLICPFCTPALTGFKMSFTA